MYRLSIFLSSFTNTIANSSAAPLNLNARMYSVGTEFSVFFSTTNEVPQINVVNKSAVRPNIAYFFLLSIAIDCMLILPGSCRNILLLFHVLGGRLHHQALCAAFKFNFYQAVAPHRGQLGNDAFAESLVNNCVARGKAD